MDRRMQAQIETDPVLWEAAEWLLELRDGNVSGERITEWQQWLSEAAHRQAFDRVESLWDMAAGVKARWPAEAELAGDEYSGDEGIAAWRARAKADAAVGSAHSRGREAARTPGSGPWGRTIFSALAASAIAAAAIAALVYWPWAGAFLDGGSRISISTGVGQTRTVTLRDGTVISVGGDSSLVAVLRRRSRTVWLASGEAYFRVRKDAARPFTVRAGRSTVTDLGTIFDVRHVDRGLVVSVAEGVVRVTTPPPPADPGGRPLATRLSAGHRLALERFDTTPQVSPIDPDWAADWRQGRLHYLDEPLGSVAADLERYSGRRIIIADPDVARLRVTAVVSLHDIGAWLASLSATFPVRVLSQSGSVTIERRRVPGLP
jgi:transmembrane sensor